MTLGEKSDGKMYSKVLRRCVMITDTLNKNKSFTLREVASDINVKKTFTEFFISRTEKQMSTNRILDYLRYLSYLKVIVKSDDENNLYSLNYSKPSKAEDWIQQFSDIAFEHLCGIVNKNQTDFLLAVRKSVKKAYKEERVPTVNWLISEFDIESGRTSEIFKWSLYIFMDSPLCPFEIKRIPYINILEG